MPNLFPQIDPTRWDVDLESFQERDQSRAGDPQINEYDPVVRFRARGEWGLLSRTEYDQIEDHWWANRGGYFTLIDFKMRKLRGLWVAVADGVATTYTLPATAVTIPTIKHNGVAAATPPALSAGTGLDGADQIIYTAGSKPAAGVIITLDTPDARQVFEAYYITTNLPPRDVEADIDSLTLEFAQKVLA